MDRGIGGLEWRRARSARGVVDPGNPTVNYPITRLPDYPIRDGRPVRESGFTMIELMVVMTIIVILTTLGMTQYQRSVIYARESVLKEDLFRMRDAIDQYFADKGQYPATLDSLVSDGYVRKIPDDPFTKNNSSWQAVPAEPDANNPTAQPGVYDVKSGSDATALDGTKYAEWD